MPMNLNKWQPKPLPKKPAASAASSAAHPLSKLGTTAHDHSAKLGKDASPHDHKAAAQLHKAAAEHHAGMAAKHLATAKGPGPAAGPPPGAAASAAGAGRPPGPIMRGPDGGLYREVNGKKVYVDKNGQPTQQQQKPPGTKEADAMYAELEKKPAAKGGTFDKMSPDQLKKADVATTDWMNNAGTAWAKNPNDAKARAAYQQAIGQSIAISKAKGEPESERAMLNKQLTALRQGKAPKDVDDGVDDNSPENTPEKKAARVKARTYKGR